MGTARLPGIVRGGLQGLLLAYGAQMLRYGRHRAALSVARQVLEDIQQAADESGDIPPERQRDFASALHLKARALARAHSPNAVPAYLQARQWSALSEDDINFLGGYFLNHLPKTFFAYPVYVDWYHQADDPVEAEDRIRRLAEIRPDEPLDEPSLDVRKELNEYLAAQFPRWHWTLEHLSNAYLAAEDLDRAYTCLAEWAVREPENAAVRCRERLVAAQRHLRHKQVPEALGAYEAAMLAAAERSAEAARLLLSLVKGANLARLQVRRLRQAVDTFGETANDADLLLDLARWAESVDGEPSLTLLRRAGAVVPEHAQALWELACAYDRSQSAAEALSCLERYVNLRPDDARALAMAARLADAVGHPEEVVRYLQPLPERTVPHTLLYVKALVALGRMDEAEPILVSLDIESVPPGDRADVERLLADIAWAKGDYVEAEQRYAALCEAGLDDWQAWHRLGKSRMALESWETAVEAFSGALARKPGHLPSLNARAAALYRCGRTDVAAEDLHASLERDPTQPTALHTLGLCLLDVDAEAAETFLAAATERAADRWGAWAALAALRERRRDWSGARDAYERALQAHAEPAEAVAGRLAYVAVQAGDFAYARPLLEQRLAREGPSSSLLYHLGLACVQLGDLSEGARHWQTALLQHDDDGLRSDLAWLHVRLADAAAAAGRRAEMTQHWNTALELLPDVRPALVNRWAAEAWRRLRHPDSLQPTSRDFEIAHDLMEEVLAFNPDMPQYRLLAGLCAARIGDWPFAEELVEPLSHKGQWAATASYCVGLCLWERNLHDAALTTLSLHRDWERWETAVQAFRTQIYLASEDVERTVRELAMLRALAPDVCTADAAASVLLHLRCWRNAYELAQEVSFAERSDLVRYALGTAALMMRRETEGLEGLEQVSPASPWHAAARELRRTGYKRRALRALQTLGWEEVVRSLEEILRLDEEDETIRAWMDRAQDFAMLMRREGDAGAALAARWRARLRQDPRDVLPLHQWAVHAYWDAQQEPTPDRWRLAMSLWGTLLNLESYWMEWARARLRRHDPGTWQKDSEDGHLEAQVRSVVVDLRRRHMVSLISEMTDAVLGDETTAAALDDLVLDFLREFETAGHWRDWLTTRADLADAVLPYGGDLLETLHRMQDSRDVLTATENVQPTPLGERLLIYLSSLGSLLAAAETGNEALARERAQEYFDSTDPTERRYARVIFVLATRQAKDLAQHPRDGLEIALRAFAYAREVGDSALLATVDWEALFAQLSDGLVSEVEAHLGLPFEERVEAAAGATDLLRKVHEATNVRALIHAIVRLTLFHVRALQGMGRKGRRAADGEYFTECDAEALDRIQEALLLAPDHVTMQQEAAQLRLRRGLVALQEDRLNEAMIDLARAHELDPVSHRIAAAYTHLLMEQATRLWEERRDDASREAMTLAHRVLATNPTDAQLLVRCSRFLDVPEGHALREAPEYRRLASLYMRQAREEE